MSALAEKKEAAERMRKANKFLADEKAKHAKQQQAKTKRAAEKAAEKQRFIQPSPNTAFLEEQAALHF